MEGMYPVFVALGFNLIDLISGIFTAVKNKDVQSSKLRDGLFKKIGFILCYAVAFGLDKYGNYIGFDISVKTLPIVTSYAVITEIVSIIENIHSLNPEILPEKLLSIFKIETKE